MATRMIIECPCGVVLEGPSAEAVVSVARRHALDVHEMELTDEQARSMARPA